MRSSKTNKTSFSTERLISSIRRELGEIILENVEDNSAPLLLSVTQVKVAKDLSSANVYITATGSEQDVGGSVQMLNKRSKSIRQALARRLNLRRTPELKFYSDNTRFELERIDNLLDSVT